MNTQKMNRLIPSCTAHLTGDNWSACGCFTECVTPYNLPDSALLKVSEGACSGRAWFRTHQSQISTGWVLDQAFSIHLPGGEFSILVQLWDAAFHSVLFCPWLVHCILLEQNLPTDMYRFPVLLINDISAVPVFTKESNHTWTSLCVRSDLHYFVQPLAKVPCSERQ